MNRTGKFIVIEGLDQSGKKTQTDFLAARLSSKGFQTMVISFPVYSTKIGKEIKRSLSGAANYPPEVRHMLLSANRWEMKSEIEKSLGRDMFLICNRYCDSNLAYGIANGLDSSWLVSLDKGLPKADLTVLVNIPASESQKRKTRNRDIHEMNADLLFRVGSIYRRLAAENHWNIINGVKDSETVSSEIWDVVKRFYSLAGQE